MNSIHRLDLWSRFNDQCSQYLISKVGVDFSFHLKSEQFDFYLLRDVLGAATNIGILTVPDERIHLVAKGELDKRSLSYGIIGFALTPSKETTEAENLLSAWSDYFSGLEGEEKAPRNIYERMVKEGALQQMETQAIRKTVKVFIDPMFPPQTPEVPDRPKPNISKPKSKHAP